MSHGIQEFGRPGLVTLRSPILVLEARQNLMDLP